MSGSEKDPIPPWQDMFIHEEVANEDKARNLERRPLQQQQTIILGKSNGEGPKKRKVELMPDHSRSLLGPKYIVNKYHLDEIFAKMREKEFDPSPNILEELKNRKYQENGSESSTMLHYKEIKDIIMRRIENAFLIKSPTPSAAIVPKVVVLASDTETSASTQGRDDKPCARKFITVKYGIYRRKVGIDGTTEAIKEVIKSMFKLRTSRAFWLEDEEHVACPLDRSMQQGNYTLRVDSGVSIKVRSFDKHCVPVCTETVFFNIEEDYKNFMAKRGWTCLVECEGKQNTAFNMDELQHGGLYRGMTQ